MAIGWNLSLTVGIDRIDDQHKILYEKVNNLFVACQQRQGKKVVGDMLKFLEDYTKLHFTEEEEYMRSIDYPEYNNQCEYHRTFIRELDKLSKQYSETGDNLIVTLSVNSMLVNWLNQHITKEDTKIAKYIATLSL